MDSGDSFCDIQDGSEISELQTINNFIYKFSTWFEFCQVPFERKPLRQILEENLSPWTNDWHVVIVYLHNDEDNMKHLWTEESYRAFGELLNEYFRIVAWDLTSTCYHELLQETLEKHLNFYYDDNKSALLFVLNINGQYIVVSNLRGDNITTEMMVFTMEQMKEWLIIERDEHLKKRYSNRGSKLYQQNMLELLGDRDYDCFESDQHEEVKEKIRFALYGPPLSEDKDKRQEDHVEIIFKNILEYNNKRSEFKDRITFSCIFNCFEPLAEEKMKKKKQCPDYNPDGDVGVVPVFVIRSCQPSEYSKNHNCCRVFVDHDGRVYNTWQDYICCNKLHQCLMVLPLNGRYQCNNDGEVLLEEYNSPSCCFNVRLGKGVDKAASGVGLLSGGIMVAAAVPAITVAPIVVTGAVVSGIGAGIYSMFRSSSNLADRKKHAQDISLTNPEARGAYLNILAGSFGMVGAGANAAVSQLASRGLQIGSVGKGFVNIVNGTNLLVGGVAVGNSAYEVYCTWKDEGQVSSLTILQLSASLLFFANSVYSFKTAGNIIEESQSNTIKELKSQLGSKNKQKMFTKMHKETIRMKGGNIEAGNAEVISAVRNVPNKDQVFRILKANNKLFNKSGVKFSASGSQIVLNGEPLDLASFGSLSKPDRLLALAELPSIPLPQSNNVDNSSILSDIITTNDLLKLTAFGQHLIENKFTVNSCLQVLLSQFSETIKAKIIEITKEFINEMVKIEVDFTNFIKTKIPIPTEPLVFMTKVVLDFIRTMGQKYEKDYNDKKRKAREQPGFDEKKFDKEFGLNPRIVNKSIAFTEMFVNVMLQRERVVKKYMDELLGYFISMMTSLIVNQVQQSNIAEIQKAYQKRVKKTCRVCIGYYFEDS